MDYYHSTFDTDWVFPSSFHCSYTFHTFPLSFLGKKVLLDSIKLITWLCEILSSEWICDSLLICYFLMPFLWFLDSIGLFTKRYIALIITGWSSPWNIISWSTLQYLFSQGNWIFYKCFYIIYHTYVRYALKIK